MKSLVAVVVIFVLFLILILRRSEKVKTAKKIRLEQIAEKDRWKEEKIMSYGQVNQVKEELLKEISQKFQDDEEKVGLLKEIIEEWAELKIKTFQDRRSWIRKAS